MWSFFNFRFNSTFFLNNISFSIASWDRLKNTASLGYHISSDLKAHKIAPSQMCMHWYSQKWNSLNVRLQQTDLNVVKSDLDAESRIFWMSVRTSPNSMSALESLTVSSGLCFTCKPIWSKYNHYNLCRYTTSGANLIDVHRVMITFA